LIRSRVQADDEGVVGCAQDALVQSTQSIALDLVQLYKALGGGWETVEADKKNEVSAAK
jgi:hypothetical protein